MLKVSSRRENRNLLFFLWGEPSLEKQPKQETILQELKEKIETSTTEETVSRGQRIFRGFKAVLRAEVNNVSIEAEVRYAKIDSSDVDALLQVVTKQKSTGLPVHYGFIGTYHKGYYRPRVEGDPWIVGFEKKTRIEADKAKAPDDAMAQALTVLFPQAGKNADGSVTLLPENEDVMQIDKIVEVPNEDIEFLQILPDGSEKAVEKFKRTAIIEVEKIIPALKIDNYLVESRYELWAENVPAIWRLCEQLQKQDLAAVARFTFGNTFRDYYAILHAHVEEGKFVLIMDLTRMNLALKHLMNITDGTAELKTKKQGNTVQSTMQLNF